MQKYLIIDLANTFFRSRHAASRASSMEEKVAFSIHVTLSSIAKCWRDQKATHVVICLEGKSWRKKVYGPYKKNRDVSRQAETEEQQDENRLFYEAYQAVQDFLINKTNCTVIQHSELEGDDLIAGWVQGHPDAQHVIISTDSDFHQLLTDRVTQYNGVEDELYTLGGIIDGKGRLVMDKKTKLPKAIPDPVWILFEKCMRGDPGDNVFSAYPRVRTKSTKNKIGLEEAFQDLGKKGYAYNNLMLQKWVDHNQQEHRVLDDYNRNVMLIDLTAQPTDIRLKITQTVLAGSVEKNIAQIGVHFLKFCGKHELIKAADMAQLHVAYMSAAYPVKI
jgi:5'-3' exonuclease